MKTEYITTLKRDYKFARRRMQILEGLARGEKAIFDCLVLIE